MPTPARRAAAGLLVLCVAGCSTPGRAPDPARRSVAEAAGERARVAHHAVDRTAEYAGRVIYPIAFVAAFPAYVLAGGARGR